MFLDHEGNFLDGFELAAASPAIPLLESGLGHGWIDVVEENHERMVDRPGTARSKAVGPGQLQKRSPLREGKILGVAQPPILAPLEPVLAFSGELSMFGFAHFVDGLVEMLSEVELVEDDFLLGSGQVSQGGVDEGLPHVHGHGCDGIDLLGSARSPELVQGFGLAIIAHEQNLALLEIADDGQVVVAALLGSFIDAQVAAGFDLSASLSSGYRSASHAPGLVPADPGALGNGADIGITQPDDDQSFEERREARAFFGPRHSKLFDSMGGTVEPWYSGMEQGPILEGVEVAPASFPVIVDGGALLAFGTDPQLLRGQSHGDVDLAFLELEFHLLHAPRSSQTEQLRIESLVVHESISPGSMPGETLAPLGRRRANELTHPKPGRATFRT